jgi:hypothetical protein
MAKVICKLPNASSNINGIRFVTHRDGMISEEIDDEVALGLLDIPGYELHDPGQTDKVAAAVLEAARKKAEADAQGQNSQPPAGAPAGATSSAGGTPPASNPPANPPAASPAPGGGAPDPTF